MKPIKQLEVHEAAQFFFMRTVSASAVVVLTNKPELVVSQYPADTKLFVASDSLIYKRARKNLEKTLPTTNFISSRTLDKGFLEDKILVCVDYIEKQSFLMQFVARRFIAGISHQALISVIAVQKNKRWSLDSLRSLLSYTKTLLAGNTKRFSDSATKSELVALDGRLINVQKHSYPTLPVLAILHIFNEQDVITSTITHLLEQGVAVHVIDNWSTDDTFSIIEKLALTSSQITYERFPNKPNNSFELGKMLTRVAAVAREKKQYDWIMLNDADEIRWSPWKGVTLQQAISFIDSLGYNAIDYTVFNFVPTTEGFNETHDLKTYFKFGEFSGISGHFVQIKTWKNTPGAELAPSGGHRVAFADQKVFPLKFFLGHYPIRSSKHARTKVFKERRSRYSKAELSKGWHVHYNDLKKDTSFLGDEKNLLNFSDKAFNETFILERLTGIGIKREDN